MTNIPFQYSVINSGKYLTVHATGLQRTHNDIIEYAKYINRACKQEECNYVLLDETLVTIQTSVEDEVNISDFAAFHQNLPHISKMACVPNKKAETNAKFFQALASAKHFNFRVFPTIDEAAEWLSE